MNGIGRLHKVFEQFSQERSIGAERKALPDAASKERDAAYIVDQFLPRLDDDTQAQDIFPGKGQITVPVYKGSGTLTANYQGNSESGSAQTSFSDGYSILSRQLYFEEGKVDALQVKLEHDGWKETVYATHYHIDRSNPENSYQATEHWHIPDLQ